MIVRPRQTGQMDSAARTDALAAEGRRLLDLCSADLDADVVTCSGWQSRNASVNLTATVPVGASATISAAAAV